MTTNNQAKTTVPAAVMNVLRDAASSFALSAKHSAASKEAGTGGYTGTVKAAILSGKPEVFAAATDSIYAEIRQNVGGIAVKMGASKGKGNVYTVPSGLRSACSVLRSAFALGVELVEGKDARSFRAIRDDVREAQAEAERAALPAGYVAVLELAEALAMEAERVRTLADFLKDDATGRDKLAIHVGSLSAALDAMHSQRAAAEAKAAEEKAAGDKLAEAEAEAKPEAKKAAASK